MYALEQKKRQAQILIDYSTITPEVGPKPLLQNDEERYGKSVTTGKKKEEKLALTSLAILIAICKEKATIK
ncbi:9792_t:CDS:2, partial [Gigaspora rosea]